MHMRASTSFLNKYCLTLHSSVFPAFTQPLPNPPLYPNSLPAAICPDGELVTGRGSRFILSGSEQLYEKCCQLTERITELEIALGEIASREKEMSVDGKEGLGTPGSRGVTIPVTGAAGGAGAEKRRRAGTGATAGRGVGGGGTGISEEEAVHPLLTKEKLQVKSHIDLITRPRPGRRFEKNVGGVGSSSAGTGAGGSGGRTTTSNVPGEMGRSQGGLIKTESGSSGIGGGKSNTPGGGMNPDLVLDQFLGMMGGYHPLFSTAPGDAVLPPHPHPHSGEVPHALLTALQSRIHARIKRFIPFEMMGQMQAQLKILYGQALSSGSP
jgi:hypothetical protein